MKTVAKKDVYTQCIYFRSPFRAVRVVAFAAAAADAVRAAHGAVRGAAEVQEAEQRADCTLPADVQRLSLEQLAQMA